MHLMNQMNNITVWSVHLVTNTIMMKRYLLLICAACLMSCEKPYIADDGYEEDQPVLPDDVSQACEVLWAENDTARFYLQGIELSGVVLTYYPTPSVLLTSPVYRLPTNLEASQVLRYADLPDGYWLSKQRILCVDEQSGNYHTFVPHGTVTKAGMKTKYCILPIRTERTSEVEHFDITINDEWE